MLHFECARAPVLPQTPLEVWYGSQTGTAENYAKQLATAGKKHGFKARAVDLDKWKGEDVAARGGFAIFVMATYGEGDPTDNAVAFHRWLTKDDTPAGLLSKLRFTVFGLGNRQYEHYNKMGKVRRPVQRPLRRAWGAMRNSPRLRPQVVDARLAQLGASRVYRHGEGDDAGNLEEDFDAWREGLWAALTAAARGGAGGGAGAGAGAGAGNAPGSPPPGRASAGSALELGEPPEMPWRLITVPAPTYVPAPATTEASFAAAAGVADLRSRHFFAAHEAVVVENRELRQVPGAGLSTRHIELDLDGVAESYVTADTLYVNPGNDESDVTAAARILGLDLDQWFVLEPASGAAGEAPAPLFPTPASVRTLLTQYLDLHGQPRKDLLAALAHFATAADDRAALLRLASREGRDHYNDWVVAQQRSVVEVLAHFPSLRLPLQACVHIIPRLQPRAYTIASSSLVQPRRVAIIASLLDAPKPGPDKSRRLRGVCTHHLLRAAGECSQSPPPCAVARFCVHASSPPPPTPSRSRLAAAHPHQAIDLPSASRRVAPPHPHRPWHRHRAHASLPARTRRPAPRPGCSGWRDGIHRCHLALLRLSAPQRGLDLPGGDGGRCSGWHHRPPLPGVQPGGRWRGGVDTECRGCGCSACNRGGSGRGGISQSLRAASPGGGWRRGRGADPQWRRPRVRVWRDADGQRCDGGLGAHDAVAWHGRRCRRRGTRSGAAAQGGPLGAGVVGLSFASPWCCDAEADCVRELASAMRCRLRIYGRRVPCAHASATTTVAAMAMTCTSLNGEREQIAHNAAGDPPIPRGLPHTRLP